MSIKIILLNIIAMPSFPVVLNLGEIRTREVAIFISASQPCLVLDLGCGSGLSGECLEDNGHYWYTISLISILLPILARSHSRNTFNESHYFVERLAFNERLSSKV
jgi:predicted TPR repeat methyltransferase